MLVVLVHHVEFCVFWCLHHLVVYNLELLWIVSWFSKCMHLHISQALEQKNNLAQNQP